jgi:hypothetical protein
MRMESGVNGQKLLIRFGLKISLLQRRKPSFRNSCIPGYAKAIPVNASVQGALGLRTGLSLKTYIFLSDGAIRIC